MLKSVLALSSPAAAESLNDLSPRPPMSYSIATLTAGLPLVGVVLVLLLLHAATTNDKARSATQTRSPFLMPPPSPGRSGSHRSGRGAPYEAGSPGRTSPRVLSRIPSRWSSLDGAERLGSTTIGRVNPASASSTSIDRPGGLPATVGRSSPSQAHTLVARTTPVDAVGLEERAAALAKRSIKRESKLAALDLAVRCVDLTTLEGADTPGKVVAMCAKAVRPDPTDPSIPSVAAVCIYPELVPVAARQLSGSGVRVASVAGAFPSGLGPLDARLQEIRQAVAFGADEVDIVLNRSAFLSGRYRHAFEEIAASKEACGP